MLNKNGLLLLFFLFVFILLQINKKKYGGSRVDNMPDGPRKEEARKQEKKVQENIKKSTTALDYYEDYFKKKVNEKNDNY